MVGGKAFQGRRRTAALPQCSGCTSLLHRWLLVAALLQLTSGSTALTSQVLRDTITVKAFRVNGISWTNVTLQYPASCPPLPPTAAYPGCTMGAMSGVGGALLA